MHCFVHWLINTLTAYNAALVRDHLEQAFALKECKIKTKALFFGVRANPRSELDITDNYCKESPASVLVGIISAGLRQCPWS